MTDRELFIAALERVDTAARDAWLHQACASDAEHRRRVDVLLRAHEPASKFLADPAAEQRGAEPDDPTRTALSADESAPATAIDVLAFLTPTDKPGLLGTLDHYEVLQIVGTGGMGVVLKAFDPKLHRLVAVKVMAPHLAASAAARKRFEREARAVAAVRNEHVVAIHAVEPAGPAPYLVMEFVGGLSLQDRLEQKGPLEVKEILRIGMQTARGLAAAHAQGLVHRDVKPANILLENGVDRVKITDFGLARTADDANLTQSGAMTGPPDYMSPEQAAGMAPDAGSDLFSLGSVLYALCTGHPPFRAETPLAVLRRVTDDPARPVREINPDIPDWLDAIVRKLLAKSPPDRFQTATEVAELLGQHLAHLQQPAAVPMPPAVTVPGAGERVWREIFTAVDRDRRVWQHGTMLTGLLLIGLTVAIAIAGWIVHPILFAPAVIGLALIALGGFERQRWDVPYKDRTIRFENSPFTGERLYVDGVRIAKSCFGGLRELRGTIPDGPGAGDEVQALCEAGLFYFKCRIAVSEGGPPALATAQLAGSDAEAPPAARWLVAVAVLAVLGLLFKTRESYWEGYFRPGYFAPLSMLVTSGLLLAVLWWCRHRPEPRWYRCSLDLAMAVVVAGTVAGLLASWEEGSYLEKLAGASTWHTAGLTVAAVIVVVSALIRLARAVPSLQTAAPPAPTTDLSRRAFDGRTAFAIGFGNFVLVTGLLAGAFVGSYARPEEHRVRLLTWIMGVAGSLALLSFGPGVFIARRWWRKRQPADRRVDNRAAIFAGLGLGMTIMPIVLTVVRTPALREAVFGAPDAGTSRLAINRNSDFADRVTLERDGSRVAEFGKQQGNLIQSFPPGAYTIRGFQGDREVYREDILLREGERSVASVFGHTGESAYARLRVECHASPVTVTLSAPGHTLTYWQPGSPTEFTQGLRGGGWYQFRIARGRDALHTETFRLTASTSREIYIPAIVAPERTVELKPKSGGFPSEVVRMRLSPDRFLVAAERASGPILVFDSVTGEERFTVTRPKGDCTAFAFTPSGRHLAYLAREDDGPDYVLRFFDTQTREPTSERVKPRTHRLANAHALAISPDGLRFAVSTAHNFDPGNQFKSRIHRWENPDRRPEPTELPALEWQDGIVEAMQFSADGSELLAVSGADSGIALRWQWESREPRRKAATMFVPLDLLAVSRALDLIGGWDHQKNQPVLWSWRRDDREDDPSAEPLPVRPGPLRLSCLAAAPDGQTIAAGTKGGLSAPWEQRAVIRLFDRKAERDRAVLLGHTDWPLDLAFTSDGKELVSAGKDGTVRFWKVPSVRP